MYVIFTDVPCRSYALGPLLGPVIGPVAGG